MANIGGQGYSPVYNAVVMEINQHPVTNAELTRRVSKALGRDISHGSVLRAALVAVKNGCAVRDDDGCFSEPHDALHPMCAGFSIIELLVIVAVIALLTAIISSLILKKPTPTSGAVAKGAPEKITDINGVGDLHTITHDGHKLIVFVGVTHYAGHGGLIHHPDCECGVQDGN